MRRALLYLALVSAVVFLALGGLRHCTFLPVQGEGAADSVHVDTVDAVMRLRAQSRLYTSEYRIHKVVTHDDLLRFQGQFL